MLRYRSRIRCDGPNARRGGSGGGSGIFSPSSLFASSELGVWLDPSDTSTLFQDAAGTVPVTSVGQSVLRINDKSGSGNHATQTTAGQAPTYQIDSNGKSCLSYDGATGWFVTPTITPGIDKVQVFAGVRKLSDVNIGIVCEFSPNTGTNTGAFRLAAPHNVATANYGFQPKGTSVATVTATTYASPITSVLAGLADIAAPSSTIRVNGGGIVTSSTSQGTGNFLAYPLYIGSRGGTSLFLNGNLYGLIVRFGANLTADQIASTENWVNARTGAY